MNQSMNDGGDCRTALATPGLLKSPPEPGSFRRESISKFLFCIGNGLIHEVQVDGGDGCGGGVGVGVSGSGGCGGGCGGGGGGGHQWPSQ